SYLLFRRKNLNLFEHSIISGMILLGIMLISLFGNLFFCLNLIAPFSDSFATISSMVIFFLTLLYIGYAYINAFRENYSILAMSWRILFFYVLIFLEIFMLFVVTFGIVSDWKFGTIKLSVFD